MPPTTPAVRRVRRGWAMAFAAGWVAAVSGVMPAHAQEIGYTASFYVARGSYPAERVTGVYVFNGVDVAAGPVRASVSVPFLRQQTTFTGTALDPSTGALPDQTSTGFGDPLIRVDVRVLQDRARTLQVGVAGSVKPPMVDAATGRGTGEADVAVGGSVFKAVGQTSLFADLLFWKYGDPEGIDFEDTLSYSIGAGRALGNARWSTMVSLSGFSQGVGEAAAPLQLNVALLRLAGRYQSLAFTAGVGLNSGSEDFSIGTSWRIAR